MSSKTQIGKSGNSKYNGAGLTWTSKENASKDPFKGHWRDVVCKFCDFHGFAVHVYVYGNDNDE